MKIVDLMANTHVDLAALTVHEAVYRVLRGKPYHAVDSDRAQKIVAFLFSPNSSIQDAPIPGGCVVDPATGKCGWLVKARFIHEGIRASWASVGNGDLLQKGHWIWSLGDLNVNWMVIGKEPGKQPAVIEFYVNN